jgi:hypothetical protein
MIDQNILNLCMKVNGVKTYHPLFEVTSERGLQGDLNCIGKYCWNNGKVAFVTRDGSYYVTPYCFDVAEYLRANGYVEGSLFVPFSNGDVPEDETLRAEWKNLVDGARALHDERDAQERANKCAEYTRQKGLEELPEEVYGMCLQIPKEGLAYSLWGQEGRCYPVDDYQLKEVLGTYCQNNGRVVFVDDKGNTYVTPFCEEIRDALSASRYREGSIYVPLSNGEELLDPTVNAQWKNMTTLAREAFEERREQERAAKNSLLAAQKGLSELSPEAYAMCLHIPKEGIQTTRWGDQVSTIYPLDDFYMKEHLGTWYQNNGRVVFIDAKGEMYVTPYCEEIRALLSSAGYKEGSLYVPLSNGESLVDFRLKKKWETMTTDARELFNERITKERLRKCAALAESKYIGKLPQEVYEMSLEIPETGIPTSFMGQAGIATPVSDYKLEELLGLYCQNNGRVVFVDDCGKTYVTPFCPEVRALLAEAGYHEGSIYVPLSNGEEIQDPEINAKWHEMCNKAKGQNPGSGPKF